MVCLRLKDNLGVNSKLTVEYHLVLKPVECGLIMNVLKYSVAIQRISSSALLCLKSWFYCSLLLCVLFMLHGVEFIM